MDRGTHHTQSITLVVIQTLRKTHKTRWTWPHSGIPALNFTNAVQGGCYVCFEFLNSFILPVAPRFCISARHAVIMVYSCTCLRRHPCTKPYAYSKQHVQHKFCIDWVAIQSRRYHNFWCAQEIHASTQNYDTPTPSFKEMVEMKLVQRVANCQYWRYHKTNHLRYCGQI